MTTRIQAKRAGVYFMRETTANTYLVPTQGTHKAMRVYGWKLATRGGMVQQADDQNPVVGGGGLLMGAIGWKADYSHRAVKIPDLTDITSHELLGLLRSCPLEYALTTGPNAITFTLSPKYAIGVSGSGEINPMSLTLVNQANTFSGKGGVSIIRAIRSDGRDKIAFDFTTDLQLRSTRGDSVVDNATSTLSPASVAFRDDSVIQPQGTLTVTGVDGSAVVCSASFSMNLGMNIADAECIGGTDGYANSNVMVSGFAALSMTVYATPELATSAGRQWWESFFAEEDVGAVTLVFPSKDAAQELFISIAAAKIENLGPTEFNGMEAYDTMITSTGAVSFGWRATS